MEYSKNLSEPWFSLIKLGLKKVEGRLIKDDFSKMGSGDYILFSNNEFNFVRTFRVMITSVCKYNSFEDYLQNETLENALPGQKILLTSYGSGSGSDCFIIETTENILEKQKIGKRLINYLNDKQYVNYNQYRQMVKMIH